MSSGYTRLENSQHGEGSEPRPETENDRLVAAFDGDSDDDTNTVGGWNDDRNIEMDAEDHFAIADDEYDNGADEYRQRHDHGLAAAGTTSGTSAAATVAAAAPLSSYAGSRNSFLATSRGLAQNFLSSFRHVQSGPRAAPSNNNDGVFANLTAKPDSNQPLEDKPPTYEEAAADATPPYWETTIMAPGLSDELFIEGLPVGGPVNFAWNMMVSAAFQFVGFFLTYLLHTSHAAKQGSRAGLGFTLVQCGYYLQPDEGDGSSPESGAPSPPSEINPTDPNDVNPASAYTDGLSRFSQSSGSPSTPVSQMDVDSNTTSWISTILMVVGTLIMLKSVADYLQARRMEMAILNANTSSSNTSTDPDPEEATTAAPATEAEERV